MPSSHFISNNTSQNEVSYSASSDDLRIHSLRFNDFRSYEHFSLEDIGNLTVFIGPNASGKTNAMEGIQMLTAFESFRGAKSRELIRWGTSQASLQAHLLSSVRDLDVCCTVSSGRRECLLNGKHKSIQDMQGVLPSVVFSPDDLKLVKGAQSYRRAALDLLGCQLSRSYRILKRDYERLLRHKNTLLKNEADSVLLASVNEVMEDSAVQLYLYRSALFRNLSRRISQAYTSITQGQEDVEVGYIPSWEDKETKQNAAFMSMDFNYTKEQAAEAFHGALFTRRNEEYARKRACVGPHADRIEFFINGKNAGLYASQGQQRSLVLAWKIAEVGLIREFMGVRPVLLLDDVMSELDVDRRHALIHLLHEDTQTFITTTDISFFKDDIMGRAHIVNLA